MLRGVIPEAAHDEVVRNLEREAPEALPAFEAFLRVPLVQIRRPGATDLREAAALADRKDVPIMAAALESGAALLVTHNTRHFRSTKRLRVVRPRELVEEARAWMAKWTP